MGWEEHGVHLGAVVLNHEPMSESPGGPHPRTSDSGGLGECGFLTFQVILMLLTRDHTLRPIDFEEVMLDLSVWG